MPITCDSYYTIGSTHQFCQDYADSGEREDFIHACISDGCSSSKDSDIGARYLAKCFPLAVSSNLFTFGHFAGETIEHKMVAKLANFEFDPENLDATLLSLVYDKKSDQLFIYAWGDGQIYLKYKEGSTQSYKISYKTNAPYYLSYRHGNKTEQYEKEFGVEYATIVEQWDNPQTPCLKFEHWGKNLFRIIENASKTLDFAAVMSDGVESFLPDGASKELAQNEFLNFKSLNGEFVKRRFQGFKRYCDKNAVTHYDDLSLAAISFVN